MSEYYLFHKPMGCATARCDERHKTVLDYFSEEKRNIIFPVGRLDKDTEGLLLLTDDGELCYRLLSPKHHVEKEYFFYAVGELSPERIKEAEAGVKIYKNRDEITAPAKIIVEGETVLREISEYLPEPDPHLAGKKGDIKVTYGRMIISEGKKHQVKRTVRYCGAKVVYLKRLRISNLTLDKDLKKGEFRALTDDELKSL